MFVIFYLSPSCDGLEPPQPDDFSSCPGRPHKHAVLLAWGGSGSVGQSPTTRRHQSSAAIRSPLEAQLIYFYSSAWCKLSSLYILFHTNHILQSFFAIIACYNCCIRSIFLFKIYGCVLYNFDRGPYLFCLKVFYIPILLFVVL